MTLYLKEKCKKNPGKNNHFLQETSDKNSVPLEFTKYIFGKLRIDFYVY
jgi:hypothetical protein